MWCQVWDPPRSGGLADRFEIIVQACGVKVDKESEGMVQAWVAQKLVKCDIYEFLRCPIC